MDDRKLIELRNLVDKIIYAPTKTDAKPLIGRLKFVASELKNNLDPYIFGKLNEVIAYADQASGRVKNKEHWICCVDQSWYVFENGFNKNT